MSILTRRSQSRACDALPLPRRPVGALAFGALVAVAVLVRVALFAVGLLAGALAARARAAVAFGVVSAVVAAGLLVDALVVGAGAALALRVLGAVLASGLLLAAAAGKSGGHSPVSAHCSGGSSPGRLGAGPAICRFTGTVNGLAFVPELATGSCWSLKPCT